MQVLHLRRWEESRLTLTVESVETRSAGVAVVPGETRFTDAGPGPGVRPAGVVHGAGRAALTVCTHTHTDRTPFTCRFNKVGFSTAVFVQLITFH